MKGNNPVRVIVIVMVRVRVRDYIASRCRAAIRVRASDVIASRCNVTTRVRGPPLAACPRLVLALWSLEEGSLIRLPPWNRIKGPSWMSPRLEGCLLLLSPEKTSTVWTARVPGTCLRRRLLLRGQGFMKGPGPGGRKPAWARTTRGTSCVIPMLSRCGSPS